MPGPHSKSIIQALKKWQKYAQKMTNAMHHELPPGLERKLAVDMVAWFAYSMLAAALVGQVFFLVAFDLF